MYRTRVFLSHGQFSLFQIVLFFSYHPAVSQRRGNLKLNAAPSYWPPAPQMVNWPNLMPGGDDCYVQKKEMFGFHDKAAFYKHIGDPKMNFVLTISFSSVHAFPCKALQMPHLLPFCTYCALFTSLIA